MRDDVCTDFLRWCLPRLGLRWQGYRKVRRTVCKRVDRRRRELGLPDVASYRAHLERHEEEWSHLDRLCRIPISRFWRDSEVFATLAEDVLPRLAASAQTRSGSIVRCWSAGCASGEEAYSLRHAWNERAAVAFPDVGIEIVATDADETMIVRARRGLYRPSSLRDVPVAWRARVFGKSGSDYRIRPELQCGVRFLQQDLRAGAPNGRFDLILCRNLAFTYFQPAPQRQVLARLTGKLRRPGYVVIGTKEDLPADHGDLVQAYDGLPIYRLTVQEPSV